MEPTAAAVAVKVHRTGEWCIICLDCSRYKAPERLPFGDRTPMSAADMDALLPGKDWRHGYCYSCNGPLVKAAS